MTPAAPPAARAVPGAPRRVVVTGSSGFLGRALCTALAARGDAVTGIDCAAPPHDAAWPSLTADLAEAGPWADALADADLVVHTAARVGEAGTPAEFDRASVETTRRVVDACAEARGGAGVGRLVHVSSVVVHGRDFPDGVDETGPLRPTGNPYTDAKVASERVVTAAIAERRVRATIVRPGDVYGPGSAQWTVRAVEMLRAGRFALVDGGRGVLSPVYVSDVVAGVLAAADAPAGEGETFHITGGVGVSPRVFFGRYAAMLGVPLRSVPYPIAVAAAPLVAALFRVAGREAPLSGRTLEYVTHPGTYSVAQAARLLGWHPAVSLDEGMRRTEAWLREERMIGG